MVAKAKMVATARLKAATDTTGRYDDEITGCARLCVNRRNPIH
jgi:hypothetical protein